MSGKATLLTAAGLLAIGAAGLMALGRTSPAWIAAPLAPPPSFARAVSSSLPPVSLPLEPITLDIPAELSEPDPPPESPVPVREAFVPEAAEEPAPVIPAASASVNPILPPSPSPTPPTATPTPAPGVLLIPPALPPVYEAVASEPPPSTPAKAPAPATKTPSSPAKTPTPIAKTPTATPKTVTSNSAPRTATRALKSEAQQPSSQRTGNNAKQNPPRNAFGGQDKDSHGSQWGGDDTSGWRKKK